jgi:hypothetical protein
MERRAFVVRAVSILTAPRAAEAQSAGHVFRLGWLESTPPPGTPTLRANALVRGLRDLGRLAHCS